MPYRAHRVPNAEVYDKWPQARPHLMRAVYSRVSTGEVHIEDVYLRIVSGGADLWLVYRDPGYVVAAFITQVAQYERTPVMIIPYVGGDYVFEWAHLISAVRDYARERGCKQIELLARKGWEKVYPDAVKHWTMYRMDVDLYEDET